VRPQPLKLKLLKQNAFFSKAPVVFLSVDSKVDVQEKLQSMKV
jgi:hypothetical protein